jgi:CRISPR-associated endoribonuclease Cas6
MRLLIYLSADNKIIPYNYYYYLASALYKLLNLGSPEFSDFLHSTGYKLNGKTYKLFSFALRFGKISLDKTGFQLLSSELMLHISFPLIDELIKNFAIGMLLSKSLEICSADATVNLKIEQIETLPEVKFENINHFILYSPMVLSTKRELNGELSQYFYRYSDDMAELNRVFNRNLMSKYQIINNREYCGKGVYFEWDNNYILNRTKANKKLTKKISFPLDGFRPIEIVGNEVPFTVKGDKELIKIGYDCGFGERNSMGFGFAELLNKY